MKLRIYSKRDCHLCEEARTIVKKIALRYPLEIEEIDIESDPALWEQYRYDIPVGFLGDRKIFKYRVDEKKLERALKACT